MTPAEFVARVARMTVYDNDMEVELDDAINVVNSLIAEARDIYDDTHSGQPCAFVTGHPIPEFDSQWVIRDSNDRSSDTMIRKEMVIVKEIPIKPGKEQ